MGKYNVYIGMDVHARSIVACALIEPTRKKVTKRFGANYCAADIASWAQSLGDRVYLAYESGCTGVWLARELQALGLDCEVIAISTLRRSDKDKKQKCDKLDARAILDEITNEEHKYETVYIPTEEQEGLRDLSRLFSQAKETLKRTKQHLRSFLLRHGYAWNEKTATGQRKKASGRSLEEWLDSIKFSDPSTQLAFEMLRKRKDSAELELKQMKEIMEDLASQKQNAPYVERLSQIKGIDTLTALTIKAEFCDFERFSAGRKTSCWLGTVPKNNSSGEKDKHGPITKAGNKYLRRTLIEGISAISTWGPTFEKKSSKLSSTSRISHSAIQANERLYMRYRHLRFERGLPSNKAKVAIVNELVRWCWIIGREVQRELAC